MLQVSLVEQREVYLHALSLLIQQSPYLSLVDAVDSWEAGDLLSKSIDCVITSPDHVKEFVELAQGKRVGYNIRRIVCLGEMKKKPDLKNCPIVALPQEAPLEDLLEACGVNIQSEAGEEEDLFDRLSQQESEVISLWVKGMSLKEIADEIGTGISAVQSYKRRAMDKLETVNITELIVLAAAHGLRDCPCNNLGRVIHRKRMPQNSG
jgi:DNA-binding CsgD family transcriptional regulator